MTEWWRREDECFNGNGNKPWGIKYHSKLEDDADENVGLGDESDDGKNHQAMKIQGKKYSQHDIVKVI
jgi:hypothetical protein